MQTSCFAVLLQFFVVKIVTAQFGTVPSLRLTPSQLGTVPIQYTRQQVLSGLLSSYDQAEIPERIEMITSAISQMPPRNNRKVYLAEALRQSALQSLAVAASACKSAGMLPVASKFGLPVASEFGLPMASEYGLPLPGDGLPMAQRNVLPFASIPARDIANIPTDYIPNRTVKIQYF